MARSIEFPRLFAGRKRLFNNWNTRKKQLLPKLHRATVPFHALRSRAVEDFRDEIQKRGDKNTDISAPFILSPRSKWRIFTFAYYVLIQVRSGRWETNVARPWERRQRHGYLHGCLSSNNHRLVGEENSRISVKIGGIYSRMAALLDRSWRISHFQALSPPIARALSLGVHLDDSDPAANSPSSTCSITIPPSSSFHPPPPQPCLAFLSRSKVSLVFLFSRTLRDAIFFIFFSSFFCFIPRNSARTDYRSKSFDSNAIPIEFNVRHYRCRNSISFPFAGTG